MRIGFNDLDQNISSRIKKFDELEMNYNPSDGNIVMYNGTTFYTGSLPKEENKILYFTDRSINNLKEHLYLSNNEYKTSFDTVFNKANIFASTFKNMVNTLEPNFLCKAEAKVLFMKEYNAFYYVYSANGKLYKINKYNINTQQVFDIYSLIKLNFACNKLKARMINDIIPYNNGFLVSTLNYGLYYINIETGTYEFKFNYPNIKQIELLINDNLLIITDDLSYNVNIVNLKTNMKVESFNNLCKNTMRAEKAIKLYNNDFVILTKSAGNVEKALHYWTLDESGLSYENMDYEIASNKQDPNYQIKFIDADKEYIYISGIYEKKLFVWKWNLSKLGDNPEEIIFNKLPINYDDLYYVKTNNREVHFVVKDRAIKYNGDIIENNILNKFLTSNQVYYFNNKFIAVDGKDVIFYNEPKYSFYNEIRLNIYNENITCNNINIFIDSAKGNEKVTLYDSKTLEQIIPDFYAQDLNNNFLISLKKCKSTNIELLIHMTKDSTINGVVVETNREYFE